MEALYDRMALSIVQRRSQTDREMASSILQNVTSSLRILTVAELWQALGEDSSGMFDIEKSIVNICGGFVLVDNHGHVALIHKTAREYLLGNGEKQTFHVDRASANNKLFGSCMDCLMTTGLRAKLSRNQAPVFLDYAATAWFSHLALSRPGCSESSVKLKKFLSGPWVLTWIEYLARTKQLRGLINSSKQLSKYSAKRKAYRDSISETGESYNHGQAMIELELIDCWAVDFIKLVGKFGNNLRRSPEAIYKQIPPFCPQSSSIYQLFGQAESKNLSISGLSNTTWEDNLARLSFAEGSFSSSILAAGSHVAALASSGSVSLYDSTTFEESSISPITQPERVYRFELNSSGTLVATYGYLTTKVWEVSSSNCKVSILNVESRPRPLVMLFVESSSKLLVGTDDCKIRSLGLDDDPPTWQLVSDLEEPELEGHILNASNLMSLSKDGSLAAVAYRGHPLSAWEVDGETHINHCWRKRDPTARGEVVDAAWLPHSPEVLGVYIEGVVFRWSPYDGEVEEMAVGARRLALSRDGSIFATGDGRGTIKVFTTTGFTSLYQLSTQDTIFGLAFGPDLHRIYDVRGSYGNVWEPSALMKYAEQSAGDNIDSDSEGRSIAHTTGTFSTASMAYHQSVDSITAVATSPTGRLYCYGTERGAVSLCHTLKDVRHDIHKPRGFLSIENVAYSSDGRFVCFSDSSKRLFVKSVSLAQGKDTVPIVNHVAELSVKETVSEAIVQLLFETDSTSVLIQTSLSLHVLDLSSSKVVRSLHMDTEHTWIIHPLDNSLLLGFGTEVIRVVDWNLTQKSSYSYTALSSDEPLGSQDSLGHQQTVSQVIAMHDKKHIMVQLSHRARSSKVTLAWFETASFVVSDATNEDDADGRTLTPAMIESSLTANVARVLSCLPRNRLVFLSKTNSICTLQLPKGPIKELFSLPGDWISRDCLALGNIWPIEKSFLCPKNGEVAVVKCSSLV